MPPSTQRRRRKRTQKDVIARIPGQSGRIVAEGSEYGIHREQDRFRIHEGPGAEHVTVRGSEHRINIINRMPRPQRPGRAERPLFNFPEMQQHLTQQVDTYIKRDGIVEKMFEPEKQSRWPGILKGTDPRRLADPKYKNNWLPAHWSTAFEKLTTTSKGHIQFKRDVAARNRAVRTRREVNVEERVRLATEEYRAKAITAIMELQRAVEAGEVKLHNRTFFEKNFRKTVDQARLTFQKEMDAIVAEYNTKNPAKGRYGIKR